MNFGSLQNLMMSNTTAQPAVGDAATIIQWTDRQPATVVAVSASGKTVHVQWDKARRVDNYGMSDCQVYEYERNPEGCIDVFTLRKNGRWVAKGSALHSGQGLLIGRREKYHDFSF